jgi:hypothetical protein
MSATAIPITQADGGVRRAHDEAEPRRQVPIREGAKRSRHRVHHRHFGERIAHHKRDDRSYQVGDDDGRSGQTDRDGAAKEESDADRAADRHHGNLARDEPSSQAFFSNERHGFGRRQLYLASYCVDAAGGSGMIGATWRRLRIA